MGSLKQDWTLQRDGASMSGEGEPEAIAARICAIVTGSGAKIVQ